MDIIELIGISSLIVIIAFFVMVETSFRKIKAVNIEQYLDSDHKRADMLKKVYTNTEYWVFAQIAIMIFAVIIGSIGTNILKNWIYNWLLIYVYNELLIYNYIYYISYFLAILIVISIVIVFAKLVPQYLTIQYSEKIANKTVRVIVFAKFLFMPFMWILDKIARVLSRFLGVKNFGYAEVHSEDELRMMVSESYKSGEINVSEYKYVNNIFEFDNRIAKEIMVPRTEIVVLEYTYTIEKCLSIFTEQNLTRYIIIDEDKDNVLGMINVKEVLTDWVISTEKKNLSHFLRPVIRVIDSTPIGELLVRMQRERIHIAVLMDEYGGTSGILTAEDIIEEIVGEIRDEFDADEINEIQKIDENKYIVAAKVLISEINELLNIKIDEEDIDTIGGWILTENYETKIGDIIEYNGFQFKVVEMEDRQIHYVEITRYTSND